jgi:hypothetical protein
MSDVPAANFTEGLNKSGGIVGTAAYSRMCENGAKISKQEIAANVSLQTLINGFFAGLGLVKQYDMMEKQGELYEAQRDATLRNIALAENNYNQMALPAYKKAEEYFHVYYRRQWETKLKTIADCGLKDCEYTPDYNRWVSRGLADVVKVVNQAKLAGRRQLDKYSAGACCEQDYRFAELQAVLVTDTVNLGRVYEDERKLKMDNFFWNKYLSTAQIIQNIGSLAANINQYGKSNIAQALQLTTQAISAFDRAVESGFAALGQQGSFYGGLANLAGRFTGEAYGRDAATAILQPSQSDILGINTKSVPYVPYKQPEAPAYSFENPDPYQQRTFSDTRYQEPMPDK